MSDEEFFRKKGEQWAKYRASVEDLRSLEAFEQRPDKQEGDYFAYFSGGDSKKRLILASLANTKDLCYFMKGALDVWRWMKRNLIEWRRLGSMPEN